MKYFILLVSLFALNAFAEDCPVKFGQEDYLEQVAKLVAASDNCEAGVQLVTLCALGASGDLAIVPAAEARCSQDFMGKLTTADKKTYNMLKSKCDTKYAGAEGTLYMSMNAFCKLNLSRFYSEIYQPIEH